MPEYSQNDIQLLLASYKDTIEISNKVIRSQEESNIQLKESFAISTDKLITSISKLSEVMGESNTKLCEKLGESHTIVIRGQTSIITRIISLSNRVNVGTIGLTTVIIALLGLLYKYG